MLGTVTHESCRKAADLWTPGSRVYGQRNTTETYVLEKKSRGETHRKLRHLKANMYTEKLGEKHTHRTRDDTFSEKA